MIGYIGSRTTKERKAQGEGITVYRRENGTWQKVQTVSCGDNPSYVCFNKVQNRLYAIHGDGSTVTAFAADAAGNAAGIKYGFHLWHQSSPFGGEPQW